MTLGNKKRQDPPKPILSRAFDKLVRLPAFVLKAIYMLPFLLFGLWMLQLLYFPQLEAKNIIEGATHKEEDKNVFRTILNQNGPVARGHFHMVDEYITKPFSNQQIIDTVTKLLEEPA